MAAGGNGGTGLAAAIFTLPTLTLAELITLICLCSLHWDHPRFVRGGQEALCPGAVRQLLRTKQALAPCAH